MSHKIITISVVVNVEDDDYLDTLKTTVDGIINGDLKTNMEAMQGVSNCVASVIVDDID